MSLRFDQATATCYDNVTIAAGTASTALVHTNGFQQSIIASFAPVATAVAAFTNGAINVTSDQIVVAAHGYKTGQAVTFTATVASLFDALATANTYYIILNDANTVQLATSRANAASATYIDFLVNSTAGTYTFTPATLTACYVWKQVSMEGTTYFDVAGSTTTVSGTVSLTWDANNYGYKYSRLNITMTGGQITVNALGRSVGFV